MLNFSKKPGSTDTVWIYKRRSKRFKSRDKPAPDIGTTGYSSQGDQAHRGLLRATTHTLRHSFATHLLEKGLRKDQKSSR